MGDLTTLQPQEVFHYFQEICSIPHGSRNVGQISDYCVDFAKKHGLKYRQDTSGNVIIWKDGTSGYENSEPVILQGHLDMVAVKEADCDKDMSKEGLDLKITDGFLEADKTSLGGDDGIAIAYSLAILAADNIQHPPVEALFTVDEEIGMLGAAAVDLSDLRGKTMLNMDSEDEGIFLAGCAGGATVRCNLPVTKVSAEGVKQTLTFTGLTGGHSGVEISCQRANANVLMGRIMHELGKNINFSVISIAGGEKDNAIAKIGKLELLVDSEDIEIYESVLKDITLVLKHEYESTDSQLDIVSHSENEVKEYEVYNQSSLTKLVLALMHLPYGVVKMSNDIEGLVQTSLNLGIIKERADVVQLCYSVRSSVNSEKEWLIEQLYSLVEFLGGECTTEGGYPSWEYRKESKLRDLITAVYEEMYDKKAVVQTIHAGLECGVIAEKIPDLDCVSFGPEILDIHTTNERLNIASVERTWKLILEVLKRLK
jgi:dipeptidase D